MKTPVLLPHKYMAAMYKAYPIEFRDWVSGDGGAIEQFWASVNTNDPRIRHGQAGGKCIPLRIHGDGVPYGKGIGRSLDVLSFSSMLSKPGNTWDVRFLMTALSNGCKTSPLKHGVDSMGPIWNVLTWSFECLHAGTFPLLDENGEELTGRRAANVGRLCGEYNFRLGRRLLGEKQHIWF